MITNIDIAIIGGGPAGLCAAIEASKYNANVLLIERDSRLGGQLNKQTHKFFGSKRQYASIRGVDISDILINDAIKNPCVTIWTNATAIGVYEDGVITIEHENKYKKIKPATIIVATGASEKFLVFENNDLPGIYGAGAVQTLMNSYGILPAKEVVMLGAGNIGLIVSYQLIQAGVDVKAIMCTGPTIGGYLVHASKIRRMGVPIFTQHTVLKANGDDKLKSVTVTKVDDDRKPIKGTEFDITCDNLCISAGLSPLVDLLWQIGCKMKYSAKFGGHVPIRSKMLRTSVPNVFIAGDVSKIEEASSAMVEGHLAALSALLEAGIIKKTDEGVEERLNDLIGQLESLRSGDVAAKLKRGIAEVEI
ncbi:MAG: NAD(P)/FAD-dependent oxidoreductase [Firmicutes bacterium]|nr:NAD(P)/FAD-dependent oxidoreductase [Bacillota bacterium]